AHRAIAQLAAKGAVRVILTTNFDRLTERALEDAGVPPQVLHRPEQLASATPLAHAKVTVIKLHGDYADLEQRNTIDELAEYPEALPPTSAVSWTNTASSSAGGPPNGIRPWCEL